MIAETVFQSMDSTMFFVALWGFISMIALFVIASRILRMLNNLREINESMKDAVHELKFTRAAMEFMKKGYQQQLEDAVPPLQPDEPRRESLR